MATGIIHSSLPRPSTSCGLEPKLARLPAIPVQHPKTQLGDQSLINIRGESRNGVGVRQSLPARLGESMALNLRERTFVTMESGGFLHLGLDRKKLPSLTQRDKVDFDHCRLDGQEGSELVHKKVHRDTFSGMEPDELVELLQDKMKTGLHGLHHMFKANDPSGQGNVSKEALLRVLYTLCGYIKPDQFKKFVTRLGLEEKSSVSFEEFVSCFRDPKAPKEWLNTSQRVNFEHVNNSKSQLQDTEITAGHCIFMLKHLARSGKLSPHQLLPASCFESGGLIVQPQLKDMLGQLHMLLSDEEFNKLWKRYDINGRVHAIKTSYFLKSLDYDATGKGNSTATSKKQKINEKAQISIPEVCDDLTKEPKNDILEQPDKRHKLKKLQLKKPAPRMDKIKDCLSFKFEENYQAMLQGMQCFDLLDYDKISRLDFKLVLQEFGFPVQSVDLEQFLSRCNVRVLQNQVGYQEFLAKFWNRSESGLVHRIISNSFHPFNKNQLSKQAVNTTLTVEELEAHLVEFFHGHFLSLLGVLKGYDKYNLGVVKQYDLRAAVERLLGYSMSATQWDQLRAEVGLDPDGLINYSNFMNSFNKKPGSWNKESNGAFQVMQVRQIGDTPQVDQLREISQQQMEDFKTAWTREERNKAKQKEEKMMERQAQKMKAEKDEKAKKEEGRPLEELNHLMYELFRVRFHTFDKVFKSLDKRSTGRCHQLQFKEILKECGIELKERELDRLWSSFLTSADGMYNYTTLVRCFTKHIPGPPPIKDKLPTEDPKELTEKLKKFRQLKSEANTTTVSSVRKKDKLRSPARDEFLQKFKTDVMARLDMIEAAFQQMDKDGISIVPSQDAQNLMLKLMPHLSKYEIESLVQQFEEGTDSRFYYAAFLEAVSNMKNQRSKACKTSLLHSQLSAGLLKKLVKDWKSIRRAFRKFDTRGAGFLTITDFKQVLKSCDVEISSEDVLQILSELDRSMEGRVHYEEFLAHVSTEVLHNNKES